MKKKILILAFILLLGGNIIMSAIQMYQRNEANTAWNELYPVTTAENVRVGAGNLTYALNNIGNASPKGVYATLTALQQALPTGAAGIYVVSADGKWYYWSGSTWTAGGQYQSTGIANKSVIPEMTSFVSAGKNLFDKSKATIGYVVNEGTGAIYANANYAASDFIPVEPSTNYVSAFSRANAYYDINKNYISGAEYTTTITTPAGCYYVRVSPSASAVESFQFEKGSVATSYEPYGYRFTKELPNLNDFNTELLLPSKIYALVGQELNIYFDNIMNDKDTKYDFDVTCNIGGQYDNYYRVTPVTAGTYPITIKAYQDGVEKATVTSSIIVTAASAGSGVNKKILIIGDSTTANGICTQKLLDNFGSSEVMDITLLGTKGTAPNLNEGVSGWTVNNYFATANDGVTTNVFWKAATSSFDFSYYMAQRGYNGVDYVIINLGINDTFSYTDDATLNTKIATMLTQYQGMIDSIHAYNANIKIGLAITIPPAYDQNSFGKIYGCGQTRWRYKRNNFIWTKALINKFVGKEGSYIYLIPINTNLDTRYNMGIETLPVNARNSKTIESIIANGNCHPYDSGYWQIADVYWYWLKSFES